MRVNRCKFRGQLYDWTVCWPEVLEKYYWEWYNTVYRPTFDTSKLQESFQTYIDTSEAKLQDQLQTTELSITEI